MKTITVNDLKEQIGTPHPRPMLHCEVCGGEYSANAGDYFMAPSDYVFTCCGEPMQLVTKREVFEPVCA